MSEKQVVRINDGLKKTHDKDAAPDEPAVIDRSHKPDETPLWDKFVQTTRVPKVSPPPAASPPAPAPKPAPAKKAPVKAAAKKAPAKKAPAKKK